MATPPFLPPRPQPLLIRLVQTVSEPALRWFYRCSIGAEPEDIERLRSLEGERVVYVCNHPTLEDGMAIFGLAARARRLWYYIVAWESFKGLQGRFLQWMGCYSIRRGLGDRASIAQTLSLLKNPGAQVVIFPEGGCSYQNDTVMPFRSGAIQMPLQVMAQLAKQDPDSNLYVVPISLKYRYTQPMKTVLNQTLEGLENQLEIKPDKSDFYERLIAIANRVLANLERTYDLAAAPDLSWNQRIERLRQHVIAQCERQLQLEPGSGPIRERVYKIQALLDTDSPPPGAPELYWTTVRLLNFDAIYDGYVAARPTPERFLDTLMRLEREVYQTEHIKPKAHRRAIFRVGEPINLNSYVSTFRQNKTGTVAALTTTLRTRIQTNLAR